MINISDILYILVLGIQTSISPCPLAANIAAISYISKNCQRKKMIFLSGIAYTMGRMSTYIFLGFVLVSSAESIPTISLFLQKYINQITGPILILIGLFLIEIIPLKINISLISDKLQKALGSRGVIGAYLLGVLFALSFCPISAAFFFGSTIAISLKNNSAVILPSVYGLGTALPVVLFSFLLSFSAHKIANTYNFLRKFEKYARIFSGAIFILAGIYYLLSYNFNLI